MNEAIQKLKIVCCIPRTKYSIFKKFIACSRAEIHEPFPGPFKLLIYSTK